MSQSAYLNRWRTTWQEPRRFWVAARLADYLSTSLLARIYPVPIINELLGAYRCAAKATGSQLLWRCASNRQLPVVEALSDGSFLSVICPSTEPLRKDERAAVTVRVIEYTLPGTPGAETRYRLLTTLLDAQHVPALELAALYHERWEVESVFDELKTHLYQRYRTLRSTKSRRLQARRLTWCVKSFTVGCWRTMQCVG